MIIKIENKQIEIPPKLGGWVVQKVMPLDYINSNYVKNHRRLQVFAIKGIECSVPGCSCKGAFFVERADFNKSGIVRGIHVDLYTVNFKLMTVDHHIPRSKGGANTLANKVPMCESHNSKKGSTDPESFYNRFKK